MTNDDWSALVDTTDEWIVTRTGIRERRFAADDESTLDLAAAAAEVAIADAGLTPGDIDGQAGWFGAFGNWRVSTADPAAGAQHMRSVSDGLGFTVAISPTVGPSSGTYSSISADIQIEDSGVTWQLATNFESYDDYRDPWVRHGAWTAGWAPGSINYGFRQSSQVGDRLVLPFVGTGVSVRGACAKRRSRCASIRRTGCGLLQRVA